MLLECEIDALTGGDNLQAEERVAVVGDLVWVDLQCFFHQAAEGVQCESGVCAIDNLMGVGGPIPHDQAANFQAIFVFQGIGCVVICFPCITIEIE
ncbi:hypothetical protein CXB49_07055 [Chromobacterium sp. ATCC 53434]|nr:hypothetical protein CXB49_07055 [Chromobacterium sp. ATCC 53434]